MTTSELAFGTAVLTAAVSALATLLAYKNSRETSREQRKSLELQLRFQRDVAADQRLWVERRDIYVELLVWLQDLTDLPPDDESSARDTWQRHRVMWARAAAFGTPRVQELKEEAENAMLRWRDSLGSDAGDGTVGDGPADAGWTALRRLADEIRKELGATQ